MDFKVEGHPAGERLGNDGFDQLLDRAHAVCECERLRIELANLPLLTARKAEYFALLEQDEELQKRIYNAKPPHEERARRWRIIYCWTVAAVLVVAGFVLSLLTLEPYRLGYKAVLYCLGMAIATPYLIEKALQVFSSERLLRVLVTVAGVCALVSLMTLAVIRGELVSKSTQQDSASVVIDDEQSQKAPEKNTFYEDTTPLLEMVMVLLAFSMEVGAGVALHEAERVKSNLGESYGELVQERSAVQAKLAEFAREIVALQNEPALFVTRFWRDFHWAVLKRSAANAAKAFSAGALGLLFLLVGPARAQQPTELVILVDLSRSVGAPGPDGRTEFQKNLAAVSEIVGQVPMNTHLSVVGVTDESFAQPYILLSATVTSDPGYFGERLAAAQRSIQIAWNNRSHELSPSFPGTDLLGAFLVASQIFQKAGAGKRDVLVVISDMRQETAELNTSAELCSQETMEAVKTRRLLANLRDSQVYALGVDSAGRSKTEWMCVHDFWVRYFTEAGATLRNYSVLRSVDLNMVR
jgi:hypothetical protein